MIGVDPLFFRPLVGVPEGSGRELVIQQTAHLMARMQEEERKGLGSRVPLKCMSRWPKDPPQRPISQRFHHLPMVPPSGPNL